MPSEAQTSFAWAQVNKACLISCAFVWHIGQFARFVICLFAKITWQGILPCNARHVKIFTLLGIESFHGFFHTESAPDPPAETASGLDPNFAHH